MTYKACKTSQSAERQRHIVECLEQMLKEMPFEAITVQALCERAQVPRKTFYRYFDGKDGVFTALIDQFKLDYEQYRGPYLEGEARTSEKEMEKVFLFWYEHRALLFAIVKSNLVVYAVEQFMQRGYSERLGARLVDSQQNGSDDRMLRMIIYFSTSGLFVILLDWLRRGCEETPKEMAAMTVKLLTRPLYRTLS